MTHEEDIGDSRSLTFTLWGNMYQTERTSMPSEPWDTWCLELGQHRSIEKKSQIPCAVLGPMREGRRLNTNVRYIDALALDIERSAAPGVSGDPAAYQTRCEQAFAALIDTEYIAYTTFSHREHEPRLRLVLPLAVPIPPEDFKHAMSYLNCLTGSIGDPGAQKLSQPVFLPFHQQEREDHWAIRHKGNWLDVTTKHAIDTIKVRAALGEGRGRAPMDAATRQACKHVLLGQPFAETGQRDEQALRITYHLAKTYDDIPLDILHPVFQWSLRDMGDDAPTLEDIQDKLQRGHTRIETPDEIVPVRTPDNEPYILQYQGNMFFRDEERGYSRAYRETEAIIAAHKHLHNEPNVALTYTDAQGRSRRLSPQALMLTYGELPERSVIDVSALRSTYEHGCFREATVRWPTDLAPVYDPAIDQWLRLLGGERLLDWLSLFSDLTRLLSALVLIGEPNTGKTLLALGLATRLGSDAPSAQAALTGAFQEDLTRCPLVYIDEEITDTRFGRSFLAAIRNEISVPERSINRKYRSQQQMHGAIRCIISANHLPFKSRDASTSHDLHAIAERFFWVDADRRAADYLAVIPPETKQHWRRQAIAEHVMHLEQERAIDNAHRFGVPGDSERLADLINIGVSWNSWVTEWICNAALDRFNRLQTGDPDVQGGAFVHKGTIYVRVKTIVKAWKLYLPNNQDAPDTRPISDALKGISDGKIKPRDLGRDGNNQQRFYRVRQSPLVAWLEETGSGTVEEITTALQEGV